MFKSVFDFYKSKISSIQKEIVLLLKGIPPREVGVLTHILTSPRPPLQTPKALSGGYDKNFCNQPLITKKVHFATFYIVFAKNNVNLPMIHLM